MAVVCGFAFFTDFNTSSGVSWATGMSGAVLCLRTLRRFGYGDFKSRLA
jgi:hypothetical protein